MSSLRTKAVPHGEFGRAHIDGFAFGGDRDSCRCKVVQDLHAANLNDCIAAHLPYKSAAWMTVIFLIRRWLEMLMAHALTNASPSQSVV